MESTRKRKKEGTKNKQIMKDRIMVYIVLAFVIVSTFMAILTQSQKQSHQQTIESKNQIIKKLETINSYLRDELDNRAFITKEEVSKGCWVRSKKVDGCKIP